MTRVLAGLSLFLAACATGGAGRESNPWKSWDTESNPARFSIWAAPCGTSTSKAVFS